MHSPSPGATFRSQVFAAQELKKSASVMTKQSNSNRPPKLCSSAVEDKYQHHDKAIEQLQATQTKWSLKRTEDLDWINEELRRQGHAVQTFRDVNATICEYSQIFGTAKSKLLDTFEQEPRLSDFYVPSDDQKIHEIAFVILGVTATGLVANVIAEQYAKQQL